MEPINIDTRWNPTPEQKGVVLKAFQSVLRRQNTMRRLQKVERAGKALLIGSFLYVLIHLTYLMYRTTVLLSQILAALS